jgi:hypothetical protein
MKIIKESKVYISQPCDSCEEILCQKINCFLYLNMQYNSKYKNVIMSLFDNQFKTKKSY